VAYWLDQERALVLSGYKKGDQSRQSGLLEQKSEYVLASVPLPGRRVVSDETR
jgi:hypothetical protein